MVTRRDSFWRRVYKVAKDKGCAHLHFSIVPESHYLIQLGYKDFELYESQIANHNAIPFSPQHTIVKVKKKYFISISPLN